LRNCHLGEDSIKEHFSGLIFLVGQRFSQHESAWEADECDSNLPNRSQALP
jgi:hypothetical protein